MADSLELPDLFVEGDDDLHTIVHLLGRHGIQLVKDRRPVRIKKAHGDEGVLAAMTTAVRASTNRSVGFVLDANSAVADRWRAVCDRLTKVDLDLPKEPPAGDTLFAYAESATDGAGERGAAYSARDRTKAVLHCWLAWQKEPGRPFGTALKAHFFRHDSPEALRFVNWFKELFEVS